MIQEGVQRRCLPSNPSPGPAFLGGGVGSSYRTDLYSWASLTLVGEAAACGAGDTDSVPGGEDPLKKG